MANPRGIYTGYARVMHSDTYGANVSDNLSAEPVQTASIPDFWPTNPMDPLSFHDLRIGTGRVIPSKFVPDDPGDTPRTLFPEGLSPCQFTRLVHRQRPDTFLVYTNGSCLNHGTADARAGCAFVIRNSESTDFFHIGFRLENEGPTNEQHAPTNNRAELRAVIAATRFRNWVGEGFNTMVIATDSEYVVEGITHRIPAWIDRGWMTAARKSVKNRDLWECLLGEIESWHEKGMSIQFWRIPREWNTDADCHARLAADTSEVAHFSSNHTGPFAA